MKIIAVTNDQLSEGKLIQTIKQIEPYVSGIILRENSRTKKEIKTMINKLIQAQVCKEKLIVHSHIDLAIEMDIHKVQLPSYIKMGHQPQSPNLLIGKSIHSLEEIHEEANWFLYGHIFHTQSKHGMQPRGIDGLKMITSKSTRPVYAIGGINPEHLPLLQETGVAGVALMSSIFSSENPLKAIKKYHEVLKNEKAC